MKTSIWTDLVAVHYQLTQLSSAEQKPLHLFSPNIAMHQKYLLNQDLKFAMSTSCKCCTGSHEQHSWNLSRGDGGTLMHKLEPTIGGIDSQAKNENPDVKTIECFVEQRTI